MEIKVKNYNQSFKGVSVVSNEAKRILKKADMMVKSTNAIFLDTNIPEGHKRPLWSVLYEHLSKRQSDNKNNILIDIVDKSKHLISVIVADVQGFIHKKWTVNPLPVIGKYNDVVPPADNLSYIAYYHSLDPKTYGKSGLFDVVEAAEAEADMLNKRLMESMPEVKRSIREFKKIKNNSEKGSKKAQRALEKKREILALKNASVPHVQRPFEDAKDLLSKVDLLPVEPKITEQSKIKTKNKLPRKLKKELKSKIK